MVRAELATKAFSRDRLFPRSAQLAVFASLLLVFSQLFFSAHDGSHGHLLADQSSCEICLLQGVSPDPASLAVKAPKPDGATQRVVAPPVAALLGPADTGSADARAPPALHFFG